MAKIITFDAEIYPHDLIDIEVEVDVVEVDDSFSHEFGVREVLYEKFELVSVNSINRVLEDGSIQDVEITPDLLSRIKDLVEDMEVC